MTDQEKTAYEEYLRRNRKQFATRLLWTALFFGLALIFGIITYSNYMDLWDKPRMTWTPADEFHAGWPVIASCVSGVIGFLIFAYE